MNLPVARFLGLLVTFALLLASSAPALALTSAAAASAADAVQPNSSTRAPAASAAGNDGLMFIENVGQFDPGARFQLRGAGETWWLAGDALWMSVLEPAAPVDAAGGLGPPALGLGSQQAAPARGVHLKLSFPGANPQPRLEPFDRLATRVSYFLGSDPEQWRSDVPVWGGVRYADLYPGIDLELSSQGGQLQPRLAVRAGADLDAVRLRIEGADAVTVDDAALRVSTVAGDVRLPMLQASGMDGGAAVVRAEGGQAFAVDAPLLSAATEQPPVASPASPDDNAADLRYGTFLGGGTGGDRGLGIAVDGEGSAYVTGLTSSPDFPTTPGAFDGSYAGGEGDAFVVKLNPSGSGLVYATYLGGSGYYDAGYGIAVDRVGSAYVTGTTTSSDFPTTPGAFDATLGGYDTFVAKLDPSGSGLLYGTYLGGSSYDEGYGIAVDGAGSAYVTGRTRSSDFPATAGAFDGSFAGNFFPYHADAFVAKLNPSGSGLAYATYLGGSGSHIQTSSIGEGGLGIAVDGAGSAYVTGATDSGDFPTTPGAFDGSHGGGYYDAFVAKLNPSGSGLAYATYLGGSGSEYQPGSIGEGGLGIFADGAGNAYVTGLTSSSDFPTTPGGFDESHGGGIYDAFVVQLNPSGSELAYATYLGGRDTDEGRGIAVDGVGNVYVTGLTSSSDFPTTPGASDRSFGGYPDAFVARLNPSGSELLHATFLGGSGWDYGYGIAVDGVGSAYVTGQTTSSDFPTTAGAFDRSYGGLSSDAFVARLGTASLGNRVYLPLTLRGQ